MCILYKFFPQICIYKLFLLVLYIENSILSLTQIHIYYTKIAFKRGSFHAVVTLYSFCY